MNAASLGLEVLQEQAWLLGMFLPVAVEALGVVVLPRQQMSSLSMEEALQQHLWQHTVSLGAAE